MNDTAQKTRWIPGTKTFLLIALILTIAAIYLTLIWPFQRRVALIRDLESIRGDVSVDRRGPDWVRDWTGYYHHNNISGNPSIGYLDKVIEVRLDGLLMKREQVAPLLPRLSVFQSLETLRLNYQLATDDDLVAISEIKSLKHLDLAHNRVSGRGFGRLEQMPNLEIVNMTYCPVRDVALEHLRAISKLNSVSLYACRHLTPEGVAQFEADRPDVKLLGNDTLDRFRSK